MSRLCGSLVFAIAAVKAARSGPDVRHTLTEGSSGLRGVNSNEEVGARRRAFPLVVGTHHKAGHTEAWQLMSALVDEYPKEFYMDQGRCEHKSCMDEASFPTPQANHTRSLCVQQEVTAENWPAARETPWLFVQTIRDPAEMLVSSYVYTISLGYETEGGFEEWADVEMRSCNQRTNLCDNATRVLMCYAAFATFAELAVDAAARGMPSASYQEYLRAVDVDVGIRAEFAHMMGWALGDMVRLYARAQASLPPTRHYPLRLEDLTHDLNRTVSELLTFWGMPEDQVPRGIEAAAARRRADEATAGRHATNTSTKDVARQAVSRDREVCPQIAQMQRALGYDSILCA